MRDARTALFSLTESVRANWHDKAVGHGSHPTAWPTGTAIFSSVLATRPELYERSMARIRVRTNDLRAAFITYALANGRTETWVMDRTGHKTSQMVNRYRRVARTVVEAGLGDLTPLDEAIPEIAGAKTAAVVAAEPKGVESEDESKYRKHVVNGPIAQLVELRTFNP